MSEPYWECPTCREYDNREMVEALAEVERLRGLLDIAVELIRRSGNRDESWHDLADSWVAARRALTDEGAR